MFNQSNRQFNSETGLLKGWEEVILLDGSKVYYPKNKRHQIDYELSETDYNKLVEDGKLTDEFLINDYYNQGYYYWTEWEELDSEINYTENGQEVQNI